MSEDVSVQLTHCEDSKDCLNISVRADDLTSSEHDDSYEMVSNNIQAGCHV